MKDAKITQMETKAHDGFLAPLSSLITHVKSNKSKITREIKVVLLSQYCFQRAMVVFIL